jgi:L-amino acid N-acyltransferase YncA
MIRTLKNADANAVLEIYAYGIKTRLATFETRVPTWEEWDAKHHTFCRFVFDDEGTIAGWAALLPTSKRDCYKGVAETSIYIDEHYLGRGIGSLLMERLIKDSEKQGIWTLTSSIFPENTASHKLHLKHGFREVGVRKKIAKLDGIWRDTLILERRSTKVSFE